MSAHRKYEAQGLKARLEAVIEQLPKEGYKAAVVVGLAGRILEIVEKTETIASKIDCIARGKGGCEKRLCNPKCGKIFLETNDKAIIAKYNNNVFSAIIEQNRVEIRTKHARVVIEPRQIQYYIMGKNGLIQDSISLNDPDELFLKNYSVKYALKNIGRNLERALIALRTCAAISAIAC